MNHAKKLYMLGSGWLSSLGYGRSDSIPRFTHEDADLQYPELLEYIPELPPRHGRFDTYTKVCFSAAVLALYDADLLRRDERKNIGIVVGSSSGVYDNDLIYYESTQAANGAFTSPNLFSYTLPNVALGEIAVYAQFIGPSFCVGNDPAHPGLEAVTVARTLLESGQCESVLAGWVEVARRIPDHRRFPKGAAFAVLTGDRSGQPRKRVTVEFPYSKWFEG